MGNLPFSRTITLAPFDAVPSALLDELQDRDIADNARQTSQIMLTDQIIQSMVGSVANTATRPDFGGDDGANISTLWAYCISPGHAFLRQGSANNKIQVAPGTLLQKVANSDGTTLVLIPFTFVGTEEWTLTNGDATNPRVDLLQMKLTYTPSTSTTAVQLTVKQGTPAASPTIPDPDAGFVPVGSVVVGHNWVTGGNAPIFGIDAADTANAVVHDQRMPLRVRQHRVDPVLYKLQAAWALASANQIVTSSNSTNSLVAVCPAGAGRLIGVDLRIDTAIASGAITVGFWKNAFTSSALTSYFSYNKLTSPGIVIASSRGLRNTRQVLDAAHAPSAGPTIQASSVNKIGVPLWASGGRTPATSGGVSSDLGWLAMGVINQTNVTSLGEVSFFIAE